MKTTTLIALCLSLGLTLSAAAQQQQPTANMKIVAEKLRADKKLLVASNMELTEAEAAKFWPVYDAYQASLGTIVQRTAGLIQSYATSYGTMTEPVAEKLVTEMLAIEQDRVALMSSYRPKFAAAVSAKLVARYYQIENKIRAVVNYELADAIPLVP
jgi:hypothetical protein